MSEFLCVCVFVVMVFVALLQDFWSANSCRFPEQGIQYSYIIYIVVVVLLGWLSGGSDSDFSRGEARGLESAVSSAAVWGCVVSVVHAAHYKSINSASR